MFGTLIVFGFIGAVLLMSAGGLILAILCYVDMLFYPKKYLIVWSKMGDKFCYDNITRTQMKYCRRYYTTMQLPHNRILRRMWNSI